MVRRASVLVSGILAVSAALQGAAACSSNDAAPASQDAGPPAAEAAPPPDDAASSVPVMTVTGPNGTQVAPDWSCYEPDAAFLFRPRPLDTDGGDGGDADVDATAGDDGSVDSGIDSAPPVDATPPPPDAPAPDSAVPVDAAGGGYALALTDFVSAAPPVGATVDIIWGGSTLGPVAYSGVVDDAGLLFFPAPPAEQKLLSYHVNAGAGQASFYWQSVVINAQRLEYNSLLSSSESALVTSVLGSQAPDTTKALIVTGAVDCQYRDVTGAQFKVVSSATGQPYPTGTAKGAARAFYLLNNLPGPGAYSSNQGRAVWAMVNAPVDTTGQYMLQFFGRRSASVAAPELIDEYPVESYAGTVTVLRGTRLNASPPN